MLYLGQTLCYRKSCFSGKYAGNVKPYVTEIDNYEVLVFLVGKVTSTRAPLRNQAAATPSEAATTISTHFQFGNFIFEFVNSIKLETNHLV